MKILKRIIPMLLVLCLCSGFFAKSDVHAASNEETIYNLLTSKYGFSTAGACGVLANLKAECSFNPTAGKASGSGSYGLVQWLGGRKKNLFSYCSNNGYSSSSLNGQVAFMVHELKSYSSLYKRLQSSANTAEAAYKAGYDFCYYYERPRTKVASSKRRGTAAKTVYFPKYKNKKSSDSSSKQEETVTTSVKTKTTDAKEKTSEKTKCKVVYAPGKYKLTMSMNLRKSASKESKSLCTIKKGTKITVKVIKNSKWASITYKGKKGYVSLKYAKKL